MVSQEQELDRLLNLLDEHLDVERCRQIDERYRRALAWEEVDRPPLVVQAKFPTVTKLPPPWDEFRVPSYSAGFGNPVAMLQSQLMQRVVPGMLLGDDSPSAIRNDHGTIQIAGILGGNWEQTEDHYPWIRSFPDLAPIHEILATDEIDFSAGVFPRSIETLKFYHEKLAEHPACRQAIQIAMPDLQGPLDTAEQLWGSGIYYAFQDDTDLLSRLLTKIVDTMLGVAARCRKYATDRLEPEANTQHGYMIPGRLLIRNDSAILLSPGMYAESVRPHDARLLKEISGGSIHFCGDGEHLVPKMLEIPDLRGIDLGQPELMDCESIYAQCREHEAALTDLQPSREDLMSGKARERFPTGCVFLHFTSDFNEAREIVGAYQSHGE